MSQTNPPPEHFAPWRARLHEIIFEADDRAGRLFDTVLIVAIIASVVVITLDSVQSIRESYHGLFVGFEWFFTVIFTIEYILRLICVKKPLRYALSFYGIVDLLSILPSFIGLARPQLAVHNLMVIRTLRLLRIFRVFKLVRFLGEADALKQAFIASRHKIAVFLTTVLIIITIMAAAMHVIESSAGNEDFSSLPASMYWAVVTMTTVGYGDITPITVAGKFLSATMMIIGYSMIIVPTGILSAEMASEAHRRAARASTQHCPSCSRDGHDYNAVFCKFCGEELNPRHVDTAHIDNS